jgi:hypothetical protein
MTIQTAPQKLHTWEATTRHQQLGVDGPSVTLHCLTGMPPPPPGPKPSIHDAMCHDYLSGG